MHEMFHTFGASQGDAAEPPPFSTPAAHCTDGLDILCYEDGSGKVGSFSETRCPESEGYEQPNKTPIDCGKDTYFDAEPTPGSWLAKYWDSGGEENLFLIDESDPLLEVTTGPVKSVTRTEATVSGTIAAGGSLETKYRFEYGPTGSYGLSQPASLTGVAATSSGTEVKQTLTGLTAGATYHYRLVASNSNGTVYGGDHTVRTSLWRLRSMPSFEGHSVRLMDVSCSAKHTCTAVGVDLKQPDSMVAMRHEGGEWSRQSTPTPGGVTETEFNGVSCPTNDWCMAVGRSWAPGGEVSFNKPFAESWNGSAWSSATVPSPASAKKAVELFSVSCVSSSYCVAVGSYTSTKPETLIEVWDGSQWTVASSPKSEGSERNELNSVSCASISFCVAVGYFGPGAGSDVLVERWNGTSWSLQSTPGSTMGHYLQDVSCASPSACMAVGSVNLLWDGTSWVEAKPAESEFSGGFRGVSCVSGGTCFAVAEGSSYGAQIWNGSSWAVDRTTAVSSEQTPVLDDISCWDNVSCAGAGFYSDATAKILVPVIEQRSTYGAPTATTKSASKIGGSGATLNGTVNPGGGSTEYYFEYGKTSSYGSKAPTTPKEVSAGVSDVEVSQAIEGLPSGTVYHYRVVADNGYGIARGEDQVFMTTGPTVFTEAATNTSSSQVTLNGTINPQGSPTEYQFEYGTTSSYGSKVPLSPASIGSGTKDVKVSQVFGNLEPQTTYHFRVVASSGGSSYFGEEKTFTTPLWGVRATTNPSGYSTPLDELRKVSCSSAEACIAVGRDRDAGGVYRPLAERWNGKEWTTQSVPSPSGAKEATLQGVSCTSASSCMAVGSYRSEVGTLLSLAESWNGSSWSVSTTPNPSGGTGIELSSISCTSSSACTAVGYYSVSGAVVPLVERWNGSTWTIETTPNLATTLEATGEGRLEAVSCASATNCVAVGYFVGLKKGSYFETGVVESWNGTSWSLTTVPGSPYRLYGVSCPAAGECMVTGEDEEDWIYLRLHSGSWTAKTLSGHATDLSCSSATTCWAVGYATQVLVWNGESWGTETTTQPVAGTVPSGTTAYLNSSTLRGVSCPGACVSVGSQSVAYMDAEEEPVGSFTHTVAEHRKVSTPPTATTEAATNTSSSRVTLNGTVNPKEAPTGYQFEYGTSISYGSKIPSSSTGLGAGTKDIKVSQSLENLEAGATYHFRVVATNERGTTYGEDKTFTTPTWETRTTVNPSANSFPRDVLRRVSCTSSSACTAVGNDRDATNAERPLVERWDGKGWATQSISGPSGYKEANLRGVSCTSASFCMTVGSYKSSGGTWMTLAESWNGSSWSVSTTPNPSGTGPELLGISCSSSSACTAVGYYLSSGISVPLVERWNGSSWTIETTPSLASKYEATTTYESRLEGVSCASATNCVAAGYFYGENKKEEEIQAGVVESWNGTSWSLTTVSGSPHLLSAVSCPEVGECIAVGYGATPLSLRLHSGSWTSKTMPATATDVSCNSATTCWAVGSGLKAEGWNGESWTAETTTQPVADVPAGTTAYQNSSYMEGVSCTSSCISVGNQAVGYMDAEEEPVGFYTHTLAEHRKAP
jgi:phosphodiesterase/alkaline phosphatase D-like protein